MRRVGNGGERLVVLRDRWGITYYSREKRHTKYWRGMQEERIDLAQSIDTSLELIRALKSSIRVSQHPEPQISATHKLPKVSNGQDWNNSWCTNLLKFPITPLELFLSSIQVEFVNRVTNESLGRMLPVYAKQISLAHLMQHLANHSTYHRGQVSLMMRQLAAGPVATDFALFLMEGRCEAATAS